MTDIKLLVITFATDDTNPGWKHLEESLIRNGYDYKLLMGEQYSWGGDNYTPMSEWLKANRKDYTHILYTDAWDTLAMAPCEEAIKKLFFYQTGWVYSAEKNPCFAGDEAKYTAHTPWKYPNAGQFFVSIDLFLKVVSERARGAENDQQWGSANFLCGQYDIAVDTKCILFQAMYDMSGLNQEPNWSEFELTPDYRLINKVTDTKPLFIHGNGKVDMRGIYHSPFKPVMHVRV